MICVIVILGFSLNENSSKLSTLLCPLKCSISCDNHFIQCFIASVAVFFCTFCICNAYNFQKAFFHVWMVMICVIVLFSLLIQSRRLNSADVFFWCIHFTLRSEQIDYQWGCKGSAIHSTSIYRNAAQCVAYLKIQPQPKLFERMVSLSHFHCRHNTFPFEYIHLRLRTVIFVVEYNWHESPQKHFHCNHTISVLFCNEAHFYFLLSSKPCKHGKPLMKLLKRSYHASKSIVHQNTKLSAQNHRTNLNEIERKLYALMVERQFAGSVCSEIGKSLHFQNSSSISINGGFTFPILNIDSMCGKKEFSVLAQI